MTWRTFRKKEKKLLHQLNVTLNLLKGHLYYSWLIKHPIAMDSPGGSTPRSTPIRLTPTSLPRGQHHTRTTHSSSLLEDVLAEKKMALMQSPEVIQFLQSMQAAVQEKNKPAQSSGIAEPGEMVTACSSPDCIITSTESYTQKMGTARSAVTTEPSIHESFVTRAVNTKQSVTDMDQDSEEYVCNQEVSLKNEPVVEEMTSQGSRSQEVTKDCMSVTVTPSAAGIQLVTLSGVPPATVQYVLQQDICSVSAVLPKPSLSTTVQSCQSNISQQSVTAGQSRFVLARAGQTKQSHPTRTSASSMGYMLQNRSQISPSPPNNQSPATAGQSHRTAAKPVEYANTPQQLGTTPTQIDSSRHDLITQWLNANIHGMKSNMESDEILDNNN